MATYNDYQPDAEDNTAAAPLGLPAAAFNGVDVGNCIRSLMAALRNLGDSVPKLGGDDTSMVVAGMAAQDPASVNITGGTIANVVGGFVPVGAILPFHGTVAEAEASLLYGYGVCDGRTISAFADINGVPRGPYTMPDLRYYYLRFYGSTDDRIIGPGDTSGRFDERDRETQTGGVHDHDGLTWGHALTAAELPYTHINRTTSGDSASASRLEAATAAAHAHVLNEDAGHTHGIDITNPFVALVPLKRMF